MIAASDLTYRAGGKTILESISATFAPNQFHLIVGPNGAGKSTLVRILARLLQPGDGRVAYDGSDIALQSERALAVRRAVLSQAIEIAFPLTVDEVVMMGRYPHFSARATKVDDAIVHEVMVFFDVVDLRGRNYGTLSGGEKQRVNFARVLAQIWRPSGEQCRMLFLDEPLTFLDIHHQLDFMEKVKAFAAQPDVAVVGVVHDLSLAARFADQLLLLDHGRLVSAGASAEVLTTAHIRRVFGVEPTLLRAAEGDAPYLVFDTLR